MAGKAARWIRHYWEEWLAELGSASQALNWGDVAMTLNWSNRADHGQLWRPTLAEKGCVR